MWGRVGVRGRCRLADDSCKEVGVKGRCNWVGVRIGVKG